MSNFKRKVLNPFTNKIEEAEFLDNYFDGKNCYGVRFSNGMVYRESEIRTGTTRDNTRDTGKKLKF